MKGKVAVFVREENTDLLHNLQSNQEKIELLPFTYQKADEINTLIERAFICDFYLFTEPLTYLYVKKKLTRKKNPSVQLKVDEYMLIRAIHQLEVTYHRSLNRIAMDLPDRKPLNRVLKDLKIATDEPYVYDYIKDQEATVEKIAAYHIQLWQEDKIDHVLTSSTDVKMKLKEAGIPVSVIDVTYPNFVDAVKKTRSLMMLESHDATQVVAGYLSFKYKQQADQDAVLELKAVLDDFARKTDTLVIETANHEFALFGTKGLLDYIKQNYRTFPLLTKIRKYVRIPVNMAFGLGLKANQALHHAKLALEKCQLEEESIAYIVNDRQDILGPLGVKKHIDTSKLYQALIHKARLNNELSYNFINFIKDRNNEPFSSHDVASFYNVTKRSAERTVNKLLTGEVIKVSGEERPYLKGRPRKLFTLNI